MIIDHLFNSKLTESKSGLQVGDPVVITGNVQFQGKTGDVVDIGRNGDFVVVDLYNHGRKSFHSSDVSHNDYAGSDDEQEYQQRVAEAAGLYGPFTVTINTGERPTSRTKTKKFRREDDAILWTEDWFEDFPQYVFATAEITDPEGNVVWYSDETMVSGKDVAEAVEVVDQDYDLDQMIFTLNVDGKKISFTYWDYEEDFANADINEIRAQVAERLGQLPDQQQEQVAQAVYTELRQNLDEAGPFSYGAKKPRRGSVADLAAKKRQEQERGRQPIEPRDQMVGVAKILPKDVAEGSVQDKLHKRHQELRKKSGLPDPDYYKELKATYDLPDQERYAKAAELKKKYNVKESQRTQCPECGGAAYEDRVLAEKQDACYHKVRSRYKVWPSAYASGALVQCRKKGAANWGNKSK